MRYRKPSDSAAGSKYTYLNIPKNMDSCYYELEFKECRETDKGDKLVIIWNLLDTNTKIKPGTEMSDMLDPNAEYAETYFWRDIFNRYIALQGKEPTTKRRQKLQTKTNAEVNAKEEPSVIAKLQSDSFEGRKVRVEFDRFVKKDKSRTSQEWQPYAEQD